jgi:ABC-type enterobactin transport system permease subunit
MKKGIVYSLVLVAVVVVCITVGLHVGDLSFEASPKPGN